MIKRRYPVAPNVEERPGLTIDVSDLMTVEQEREFYNIVAGRYLMDKDGSLRKRITLDEIAKYTFALNRYLGRSDITVADFLKPVRADKNVLQEEKFVGEYRTHARWSEEAPNLRFDLMAVWKKETDPVNPTAWNLAENIGLNINFAYRMKCLIDGRKSERSFIETEMLEGLCTALGCRVGDLIGFEDEEGLQSRAADAEKEVSDMDAKIEHLRTDADSNPCFVIKKRGHIVNHVSEYVPKEKGFEDLIEETRGRFAYVSQIAALERLCDKTMPNRIYFATLERACKLLDKSVDELLEYVPPIDWD